MSYSYDHPRPALTVDCVVFGLNEADLKVVLIKRDAAPFAGQWALPGGFVEIDEALDDAARRELLEETGIADPGLEQFHTFGAPDRDPRGRVVSVAHFALVNPHDQAIRAATDAREVTWFSVDDAPELAFDHGSMLVMARSRLRSRLREQPLGMDLLPRKFSLRRLQRLYEAILGRPIDTRHFRRKILALGILEELNEVEKDVAHRAVRLYRFDRQKYIRKRRDGINLEI